MDDKKKPQNGTYTQVPNVLLDTCDLPETAQILYLRLLRKFGYTGSAFTGSIRDLSKIVRYSKSTTDRLIKVLRDANLVMIEYDTEGAMTIILNTGDLWALNKYHYEVQPSQIWDSKLPSVPEVGQSSPKNGMLRGSQNRDVPRVPEMGHDQAQNEDHKDNKENLKDEEKESVPSLSSQKSSQETKPTEVDYPLFDYLCHQKGYASEFKVPRNEKNDTAIQELRSQGATVEQVEFVFNDIWNDKDPFWQQHRGKPSTVASQFTARVWKMSQTAPKRQTVSGFANWTEDKTIGMTPTIASTPKATEKPKEPALPVGYTRLKIEKPARPRSLQARLQQEQNNNTHNRT